jgi:hypothetical protein
MTRLLKFTRIILALLFALSAIGVSASAALAAPPANYEYTADGNATLTNVCAFDVDVYYSDTVHELDYFDNNGALSKLHTTMIELDTYTANRKTLISNPVHFNMQMKFDNDGNIIYWVASGLLEMIPLPDGSMFVSAGQINWLNHPPYFVFSADIGNSGDVDAFCAALAP